MDWSPQQRDALAYVHDWYHNSSEQVAYIAGYAGTGKTTLAREFAKGIKKVRYAAFTGKAALVMKRSGCEGAATIHSSMYESRQDKQGRYVFTLDQTGAFSDADLIILDECSMVDEALGRDVLSFGRKVLVLGDPEQLPPVKGGGFFTAGEPNVMLTEIHRQAEDNPIVWLASEVRQGRKIEVGRYNDSLVIDKRDYKAGDVEAADQLLVGKNTTRETWNHRLRDQLGRESRNPVAGDKIVCLRNNSTKSIFNGGIYTIDRVKKGDALHYDLAIHSEDNPKQAGVDVKVRKEFFLGDAGGIDWRELRNTEQFTYGYALTVHKSQGSQWDNVYLFNEAFGDAEARRRWLYTGITRAAKRITIAQ